MDETVRRYTLPHAEQLLAMYEAALRGERRLTTNEAAEHRALVRRLKGRARTLSAPTTAVRS